MKFTRERIIEIINEELAAFVNEEEQRLDFGDETLQQLYDEYENMPVMRDRDLRAEKGGDFVSKFYELYPVGSEKQNPKLKPLVAAAEEIEQEVMDFYENPMSDFDE
tara:strand:- start:498 stop:818 length:321 start_codon:yes stop_codon:yes gene_type:complete